MLLESTIFAALLSSPQMFLNCTFVFCILFERYSYFVSKFRKHDTHKIEIITSVIKQFQCMRFIQTFCFVWDATIARWFCSRLRTIVLRPRRYFATGVAHRFTWIRIRLFPFGYHFDAVSSGSTWTVRAFRTSQNVAETLV